VPFSDHDCVITNIKIDTENITKFKGKKTFDYLDHKKFKQLLQQEDWSVLDRLSVEEAFEFF